MSPCEEFTRWTWDMLDEDGSARALCAAHSRTCTPCRRRADECRRLHDAASTAPLAKAPAALTSNILRQVRSIERRIERRFTVFVAAQIIAVAAALLMVPIPIPATESLGPMSLPSLSSFLPSDPLETFHPHRLMASSQDFIATPAALFESFIPISSSIVPTSRSQAPDSSPIVPTSSSQAPDSSSIVPNQSRKDGSP